MAGIIKYGQGPFDPAFLPRWEFMAGGAAALTTGNALTLEAPTTDPPTNILQLGARGGDVTYNINGMAAGPTSGGFVPDDGREIIGPLHNFVLVTVYALAGVTVHYQWFREHD